MKTTLLHLMLLAINSLIFLEKTNAQISAALPDCDKAKRCNVPQLAKVCSVIPPFSSYYKERALIILPWRRITCNQIPNHAIGIFPMDDDNCGCGRPTAIGRHDTVFFIPKDPGARGTTITWLQVPEKFGVAKNGVIFDPLPNEWWNDSAAAGWQKTALQHPDMTTDLDCNNAHVQPDSTYHYHGLPTGLYEILASPRPYPWTETRNPYKAPVVQLGWAFDGTPVYGPLCSETDSIGAGKYDWWKPKSGWELRTGTRSAPPKGPGGSYNGDYDSDYVYTTHAGDLTYLDSVNGHFAPTPEYPDGVYHQHITEEFPYIPRGYLDVLAPAATPSISNKTQRNHFEIYQTPTQNVLVVRLKGKATFALSYAEGKTIFTKTIDSYGEINTSNLSAGLYYLKNNLSGEVQKIILN